MRDKLDTVIDEERMDAETYRRATEHAAQQRRRFMWRAAWVTVCALLAASPAISKQLTGDIWHGMVLLSGFAIADSMFSYLLANSWEEQIRAFRAKKIMENKRQDEQSALEARILASISTASPATSQWTHAPDNTWQ